jgi:protoporphyrinogen oxidase
LKIAVVGGGITGLTLAYYLSEKNKVSIFEKEPYLGGLLSTFAFENTRLEKTYHHLFANDDSALQLISELGLTDKLVWSKSSMGFYAKGKLYPFTSPFDLLNFSAVSFSSRIKLGLLSLRAKGIKDWQKLSGIKAKDWLIEQVGEEAYRVVWEPLLYFKFGKRHEEVPASWVWARLSARAGTRGLFSERLGYLKGSFGVLIDALAKKIKQRGGEISLSQPIKELSELSSYDRIIFTMAPPLVSEIVEIKNPTPYLGNICLVMETSDSISKYYWVNIADNDISFCLFVEQNNGFEDEGYKGKRAVYLSNYLDKGDPLWDLSDSEILNIYLKDLRKIRPDFNFDKYWIFRERFAQPLIALNYNVPPFEIEKNRIYMLSNAQIYPQDRGLGDSIKLVKRFIL